MIDLNVLATVFIFILSPMATKFTKRFDFARDMGTVINGAFSLVFFVAIWAVTDGDAGNLGDVVERAMAVGLGGSMMVAGYRKSMNGKSAR